MNDDKYMRAALKEALAALDKGEIPVGAVIVKDGEIIASAHNERETGKDATAHAEVLCIREACRKLGGWRLNGCTMYITLEPCPMCAGAIINARLEKVVFGAFDSKSGAFGSVVNLAYYPFNCKPEIIGGVIENECGELLEEFFWKLRAE